MCRLLKKSMRSANTGGSLGDADAGDLMSRNSTPHGPRVGPAIRLGQLMWLVSACQGKAARHQHERSGIKGVLLP